MSLPLPQPRFDAPAYLAWEAGQADKHEYVGGNSDLKIDGKYTVAVKGDYHQVMYADWANSSVGDITHATKSKMRLKAATGIDVLATGGTAGACIDLVRRTGAQIAAVLVIMEIAFLNGRERCAQREVPVIALLSA